MSMVGDLPTTRAPEPDRRSLNRRSLWRRAVAGTAAGLLVALAMSVLVYRDHYQPLDRGDVWGRGAGLLSLNDGFEETRWVVAKPGTPAEFRMSLANNGRFPVQVLSVGEQAGDLAYFALTSERRGDPRVHCCTDFSSLPFTPFTLKPGQEALIQVSVRTQACTPGESGGAATADAVRVRYRFFHQSRSAWVPLPTRVTRACLSSPLRPHIDASTADGDSALVATGYDFAVPRGWVEAPLESGGGPASLASWTAPGGAGRVEFEINGGMAGVLYDEHGQPSEEGARDATGCEPVTFLRVTRASYEYTCRSAAKGVLRSGVIRIKPSPDGFERIEITSADKALVAEFLRSVKPF